MQKVAAIMAVWKKHITSVVILCITVFILTVYLRGNTFYQALQNDNVDNVDNVDKHRKQQFERRLHSKQLSTLPTSSSSNLTRSAVPTKPTTIAQQIKEENSFYKQLNKNIKQFQSSDKKQRDEGKPRKILLYTYMRSGSTFLGSLFNYNPAAFYYYEPFNFVYTAMYGAVSGWFPIDIAFYRNATRRKFPVEEEDFLADALNNLFECQYDRLPPEVILNQLLGVRTKKAAGFNKCIKEHNPDGKTVRMAETCNSITSSHCHVFFRGDQQDCYNNAREFDTTLTNNNINIQINPNLTESEMKEMELSRLFIKKHSCIRGLVTLYKPCIELLQQECRKSNIRVVKSIRLTLNTVFNSVVKKIPDLDIIYNIRDPRGIVSSRNKTKLVSHTAAQAINGGSREDLLRKEAELLCSRMKEDISLLAHFSKLNSNGTLLIQRYEDIAKHTFTSAFRIYDNLGLTVNNELSDWIYHAMHSKVNGNNYDTVRKDPVATSVAWKNKLTFKLAEDMSMVCKDVLEFFNYTML